MKEMLKMFKLKIFLLMFIIPMLISANSLSSNAANLTAIAIVRKCDLHYRSLKKIVLIEKSTNDSKPKSNDYWLVFSPAKYLNVDKIGGPFFAALIYKERTAKLYFIKLDSNGKYTYQLTKTFKVPAKYELAYDHSLFENIEGMINKSHFNVMRLNDEKIRNISCYVIKMDVHKNNIGTSTYIFYISKSNFNILRRKLIVTEEPKGGFTVTINIYQKHINNMKSGDFNINYIINNIKTISAQL